MKHTEAHPLRERYGSRALVTGGARGIGRAFAEELASAGFDLLLVDRETEDGEALAKELRDRFEIDAQLIACDLSRADLAETAQDWAARYDIGVLVSNAGISPMGSFIDIELDTHLDTLTINCRATAILAHTFGRQMVERGRGAIIVVSSASAISGAPYTAQYAATKAYGLTLAASLWEELRPHGVDVLGVCPGLTDTTPVRERGLDQSVPWLVPINGPEPVAKGALTALGRRPVVIPTVADRLSSNFMARLLPRRWTLALVGRSMKQLRRETESRTD
ncbi:MAG: SDR family NAD(P)-dependent oxidoreductase [Myxococcota bacterium]